MRRAPTDLEARSTGPPMRRAIDLERQFAVDDVKVLVSSRVPMSKLTSAPRHALVNDAEHSRMHEVPAITPITPAVVFGRRCRHRHRCQRRLRAARTRIRPRQCERRHLPARNARRVRNDPRLGYGICIWVRNTQRGAGDLVHSRRRCTGGASAVVNGRSTSRDVRIVGSSVTGVQHRP